jgi:hypothetical protein
MDPVTIGAVLAAIAGGAGGAVGSQLWAGLSMLVRRPFRRVRPASDTPDARPSGEAELAALDQSPADESRAVALAEVLLARAEADSEFNQALQAWWEQASQISGAVSNTISGGTFHGPVVQGRDINISGPAFGSPAPSVIPSGPDRDL